MMGKVVAVIVMAIVVVILIQVPAWTGEVAKQTVDWFSCQKSLEMVENLKLVGGILIDSLGVEMSINCQTEYIDITSKGEELKGEIADHIYGCYTIYGGRDRLFDTQAGTYCIICKVFTFYEDGQFEGLVSFMEENKAPNGRNYIKAFGGEQNIPEGAKPEYNNYRFLDKESIALVVTFGTAGMSQQHLIFDSGTNIGFLLYPYNRIGEIGCYSFEGKATSLTRVS